MLEAVIIGAGGHGCVVLDILTMAGRYKPVGFLDADLSRQGQVVDGLRVLGTASLLPQLIKQGIGAAIVGIGDNLVRLSYARLVRELGMELINAIHPSAVISEKVKLGVNLCIAPGVIVCTSAVIGDSVVLNSGSIIDHQSIVGEGSHVAPGAILAGRVTIEAGAFIGMGAKVLQCLKVGAGAIVGAGSVVLEDVPPGTTVVGAPARVIRG